MSRNPYAHPSPYDAEPQATRVSGLAVSSLIFGVLCCIPGLGLIALILGGAALVAISRSDGRLTGRGLATAGLVLGLLGTIFTAMIAIGTLQAQSQLRYFGNAYSFVEQQDTAGFKNILSPAAQQQITPEAMARFRSDVHAAWGSYIGPPQGMGDLLSSYMNVGQQFQSPNVPQGDYVPIPIKFDRGTALAFVAFSRTQTSTRGAPAIENMMILDPQGQPIWLFPPGGRTPAPAPAPGSPTPPDAPGGDPGEPAEPPPSPGGGNGG